MVDTKTVCIIGAGIGGLTAGALLTKQGHKVTIFEKESIIGGRALSIYPSKFTIEEYRTLLSHFNTEIVFSKPDLETIYEKNLLDGYNLDLGYHAIGGGVLSNTNNILSQLNDHVEIVESNVGFIRENGYDYPFLSRVDKIKILPNISRLIFANEKTMQKLDSISMTETINKYGKGKMKLILEIFSRSITTMNNLDKISTGEMLRAQKNLLKGSKPVGYPKGGLSNITKKLADYIIKNGGKITLNTSVEKIIINNNKAIGVLVKNEEYYFDVVVSNIIIQNLFSIVDEKFFPNDYVKKIKLLNGTGSLCAYYSLKTINPDLVGKTFHFIERNIGLEGNDVVGMIDFMSTLPESALSPKGEFLVQSYIICSPDEARNKKILEKLRDLLDKNLKHLIPNFKNDLKWAVYSSIWHLDGVAKTINNDKPKIETPINNLFLVGDCIKAPGIGINCALNSGKILARILSI
jgi:phytoene dehydrogenase-like protein